MGQNLNTLPGSKIGCQIKINSWRNKEKCSSGEAGHFFTCVSYFALLFLLILRMCDKTKTCFVRFWGSLSCDCGKA